MPKVSPEHMQARRDQIARAAIGEFTARGIHSTSMANIISASGLSAGAIYTHFAGKDDIIAYVSQAAIGGVLAGIRKALSASPLPSEGDVLLLIAEGIRVADVSPGLIVQVWGEAATNPSVRETANDVYAEALHFLREYSATWLVTNRGLASSEAEAQAAPRARVLLSAVYAHILKAALIADHDGAVHAQDFAALLTQQPPSEA